VVARETFDPTGEQGQQITPQRVFSIGPVSSAEGRETFGRPYRRGQETRAERGSSGFAGCMDHRSQKLRPFV
jgi:hypothetical protein